MEIKCNVLKDLGSPKDRDKKGRKFEIIPQVVPCCWCTVRRNGFSSSLDTAGICNPVIQSAD